MRGEAGALDLLGDEAPAGGGLELVDRVREIAEETTSNSWASRGVDIM